MIYVSLDLETSGLDPETDQILEIGAVVDDLEATDFKFAPTFHAYLMYERITGSPKALQMNKEIIDIIAEGKHPDLLYPAVAFQRLKEFLNKNRPSKKTTIAGKNFQGFDKPFLLKADPTLKNSFHHRTLDPVTGYTKTTDAEPPDLETCLQRAGITLPFKLHTAVDDAKAVICLVRNIVGRNMESLK